VSSQSKQRTAIGRFFVVSSIKSRLSFHTKSKQEKEIAMAKAGMRRPDPKEPHGTESNKKQRFPKNAVPPVPELQGKAKRGKKKAEFPR